MKPRPVGVKLFGVLVACATLTASPCLSDVLEIAPDGEVVSYVTPAIFTDEGVRPLGPERIPPVNPVQTKVDLSRVFSQASQQYSVSRDLIEAVAWRESRFRQDAVSRAGAVGVMQLMPATARSLGVDRFDVSQNILGGTSYLSQMLRRYNGDVRLSLAAYNAGPGAVDRYREVPPYKETQAYVAAILGRLADRALVAPSTPALGR